MISQARMKLTGALVAVWLGVALAPADAQDVPADLSEREHRAICEYLGGVVQGAAAKLPAVEGHELDTAKILLFSSLLLEHETCTTDNADHLQALAPHIFPLKK